MSVAKRVGIAAGALGGAAGMAYGAPRVVASRLRRAPDADARACARSRHVRRSSARHTRPRHHLRRRAGQRARSADRVVARRHALGAHVVPSARRPAQGRLPHDRVRPPRSREVGARRRRPLARQSRTRLQDRARGTRPAGRGPRRALDRRGRGPVVRDAVSRGRGRTRRGHRVALDARVHRVGIALDPHQGAYREDLEARARLAMALGFAQPRLPRRARRVRAQSASESRRARTADDGRVSTRDPPGRAARARRARLHRARCRT